MTRWNLGRSRCLLAALMVILLSPLVGSVPAGARAPEGVQRTVDRWSSLGVGSGNGTNNNVHALAVNPAGQVYAGGRFELAGGQPAAQIARWNADRQSWHAVGGGVAHGQVGQATVDALAIGPGGNLYVGGTFDTAGGVAGTGGVSSTGIARWHEPTQSWHGLAGGLGSALESVYAIGVDLAGHVYVGGNFTTIGGVTSPNIARWDGTHWHAFGGGLPGAVETLALAPDGTLYVGGSFYLDNAPTPTHVAFWTGTRWKEIGMMTDDVNAWVATLAIGPNGDLYAGGRFTAVDGVPAMNIAVWNGATDTWGGLGVHPNEPVRDIVVAKDGTVFMGGFFQTANGAASRIAQWTARDGWQPLGSGLNRGPNVLALDPTQAQLYAGGAFTTAGSATAHHIAVWHRFMRGAGDGAPR